MRRFSNEPYNIHSFSYYFRSSHSLLVRIQLFSQRNWISHDLEMSYKLSSTCVLISRANNERWKTRKKGKESQRLNKKKNENNTIMITWNFLSELSELCHSLFPKLIKTNLPRKSSALGYTRPNSRRKFPRIEKTKDIGYISMTQNHVHAQIKKKSHMHLHFPCKVNFRY